ncbi:PH domain-containing protein [Bordetella sp. FB-8]|uniref:PH domain-containing protein n=1 Tax=Bordetella sp. FB-8 TaxID=1159870 RepID=UPI0003776334|nr:PH domain-containing protein [Bordetella sp. FB-8]
MASYVEKNLTPGEEIVYWGRPSLWRYALGIVVGVILILALGLGLLVLLIIAIDYNSIELAVTNKRAIVKRGFIRRSTMEMNIQRIESVQVRQGILGRIFNFGSIIISGAGNPIEPIIGVSSPLQFRQAILQEQEAAVSAQQPSSGLTSPSLGHDVEGSTKVCPRCAETVKSAALVCRFCQHEFFAADQRS